MYEVEYICGIKHIGYASPPSFCGRLIGHVVSRKPLFSLHDSTWNVNIRASSIFEGRTVYDSENVVSIHEVEPKGDNLK